MQKNVIAKAGETRGSRTALFMIIVNLTHQLLHFIYINLNLNGNFF